MAEETKSTTSIVLTELPEWFLAAAALIYATGFLVVFTYFGSFGIQEAGGDFFKVKYVHVGILCLLIQVIIATPIYSFAMFWRARRDRLKSGQPIVIPTHLPSVVLTVNMLFTFYIYAMFAPRGYVRIREHLVPLIFGITLLGLAGIRLLESKSALLKLEFAADKAINLLNSKSVAEIGRWVLCLGVVLLLGWYSFRGLRHDLWAMFSGYGKFTTGGYILVLFVVFNLYVLWRTARRSREVSEWRLRIALWAISLCLSFSLYYLTVLTFAFTMYPFIPAEKGGGSFVDSPAVTIRFKGDAIASIPPEVLDCSWGKCDHSKALIIVEETNLVVFVADPADAGGPSEWRRGSRPRIFSINRDLTASMSFSSR